MDRYHIGESAAEAQGTWDRRGGRRQRQEEEEQEMEDEMEGLVDQKMPPKFPGFQGIPGLPLQSANASQPRMPGLGNVPPPPLPFGAHGPPPLLPGMDPNNPPDFATLQDMIRKAGLPPPPLPGAGGQLPPPPLGVLPPGMVPSLSNFPGFPPPPPGIGQPSFPIPGMDNNGGNNSDAAGGSVRRRGPLPSQEESLQAEQRKGKYTRAR